MHPASRKHTPPRTPPPSRVIVTMAILPVLRVFRYYLFARSAVYFRLRERKLVPERNGTSKPAWLVVTASNVTWVHIERSLHSRAARYIQWKPGSRTFRVTSSSSILGLSRLPKVASLLYNSEFNWTYVLVRIKTVVHKSI